VCYTTHNQLKEKLEKVRKSTKKGDSTGGVFIRFCDIAKKQRAVSAMG
jgi:hypothetical protein